jgi:hypothetical protein
LLALLALLLLVPLLLLLLPVLLLFLWPFPFCSFTSLLCVWVE